MNERMNERIIERSVSQLTNLLVITNSSLNVVIYMTFNTRFKQVRLLNSF